MKPAVAQVYFLPAFLENVITDLQYRTWLTRKAKYIIAQDRERKRACVMGATARLYKKLIHKAVCEAGRFDPFTGQALQWELVRTWDDTKVKNIDEERFRTFALLPSVDHVDPYAAEIKFEICSWLVNRSKNDLTGEEYVALCGKIVAQRNPRALLKSKAAAYSSDITPLFPTRSPQLYFLPPFLKGIVSERAYVRWLTRKARHLFYADRDQKRPCALHATAKIYKQLIHRAILDNGPSDPFTGEMLRWDLLSVWDDSRTKDPDQALVKKFSLLPTVDHVEPFGGVPGFEICSWYVNRCKADMTRDEFIALCKKIVAFRGSCDRCRRMLDCD
jgi:hypothetical protein